MSDTLRSLDASVAVAVMGYRWWKSDNTGARCLFAEGRQQSWFTTLADGTEPLVSDWRNGKAFLPRFSSDGNAMLLVLERLRELGWHVQIDALASGQCYCSIYNRDRVEKFAATGETISLVVCLAAVEAAKARTS